MLGPEHVDRRIGVTDSDRVGEAGDCRPVAVHAVKHDDPVADRHADGRILSRDRVARRLRQPLPSGRADPQP